MFSAIGVQSLSLLSKNGGTEALTKRIPPRTMGFPRDAVSGRSRSSPSAVQDPRGPTPGSGGPRPIPEGSPANPREPRKRSWTGVTQPISFIRKQQVIVAVSVHVVGKERVSAQGTYRRYRKDKRVPKSAIPI